MVGNSSTLRTFRVTCRSSFSASLISEFQSRSYCRQDISNSFKVKKKPFGVWKIFFIMIVGSNNMINIHRIAVNFLNNLHSNAHTNTQPLSLSLSLTHTHTHTHTHSHSHTHTLSCTHKSHRQTDTHTHTHDINTFFLYLPLSLSLLFICHTLSHKHTHIRTHPHTHTPQTDLPAMTPDEQ